MADVNITAQISGIDSAIEKAQRLRALLQEVQQLIAELKDVDLSVEVNL